jgi:tetratricopeptide (TPR) repeat protein
MARTLSPAKRYLICLATLAACALLPADGSAEQRFHSPKKKAPATSSITIRRPEPPPKKRQAPAAQQSTTSHDRAQTTARGPRSSNPAATSFRNPFAADPATSDAPLLLGPRSRWQTNPHPARVTQRETASDRTNQATGKTRPKTQDDELLSPTATKIEPPTTRFTPRYTVPEVVPAAAPNTPRSTLQILAAASAEDAPVASDEPDQSSSVATVSPQLAETPIAETTAPLPSPEPNAPRQLAVTALGEVTASPIRQAILAEATSPTTDADLSRLPELRSFPGNADAADAKKSKSSAGAPPLQLPDPRGFTTQPAEPVWLDNGLGKSPDEANVDQAAFEESKSGSATPVQEDASTLTLQPPFERSPDVEAFAEEAANSGEDDEPVIITDYDESPADWIAQAKTAYHSAKSIDEFTACINLCQRVVNEGSSTEHSNTARKLAADAYNRRGEMMSDAGKTTEAVAEFEAALANDPESAQAIHNRAVTLAQQSNFDAALADFNRVIELNPDLAMAYRNRAQLLVTQGKIEEAVVDYTRALETAKTDAEIYNSRAHALQQLGRFDEAIQDLKQSLEIDPKAAATFTQRANLLAERGDYENALADFKKSLELDAAAVETHRGLAWLRSTCPVDGHRDAFEALEAARNAVKLSEPDDYLTLEALAAAHANADEFDKAIDAQRRAISHAPPAATEEFKRRLALYELRQPYRAKH